MRESAKTNKQKCLFYFLNANSQRIRNGGVCEKMDTHQTKEAGEEC